MENNIYFNDQEKAFIIEILHEEMQNQNLSKYAKAVMMNLLQKLNSVE